MSAQNRSHLRLVPDKQPEETATGPPWADEQACENVPLKAALDSLTHGLTRERPIFSANEAEALYLALKWCPFQKERLDFARSFLLGAANPYRSVAWGEAQRTRYVSNVIKRSQYAHWVARHTNKIRNIIKGLCLPYEASGLPKPKFRLSLMDVAIVAFLSGEDESALTTG